MSESPLHAFVSTHEPVAVVRCEDLKRVWSSMAAMPPETGICVDLLASMCEPNADPMAVWFRQSLIHGLLGSGRLDRWRSGSTLQDRVFEVAASFPFPHGPAEVDPDALMAAIDQV